MNIWDDVLRGIRVSPEIVEHPDIKEGHRPVEVRDLLHSRRRGGIVTEREDGNVVELLLLEPEIVAWLDDHRPPPVEAHDDDDEPLHAA